jgi:2-amino-4-hydroxy-6-hydroxymethyldihydropteridine diphosphokinase
MKKQVLSHSVFLALGTNLGDRVVNLNSAISSLSSFLVIKKLSLIHETEPWGYTDQPAFLNQVLKAETDLTPLQLLKRLKATEKKIGRKPNFRYGPRLIDLDILFYDDLVQDLPGLTIPHPRLHERAFVLVPLAGIAPDLIHPVLQCSIRELVEKVDGSGVKLFPMDGQ